MTGTTISLWGAQGFSGSRLGRNLWACPRNNNMNLREIEKGRSPKRAPLLMRLWQKKQGYIFFSEHTFFAASQVPPAFSQSAAFFAIVTSPAKAGPVKASAKANANVEMSVFIALLLTVVLGGSRRTLFQRLWFHPAPCRHRCGR
jgi:hypothetical protein